MSWVWWKFRAMELTVALVAVCVWFFLADLRDQRSKANIASGTWFTVNKIFVPDMRVGDNPVITYDRKIREKFRGFWVTEVQRRDHSGAFILECTGSGINDYDPEDFIPNNEVRWEWYVGEKCGRMQPGEYRIRTTWTMRRPDWPDKQVTAYSNLFRVR